ncbi:YeiH family protein [Rhizobium sp. SAFR-030]|uniref:YeiH family protein n=1 Tax=Rhizobium sp. SAFR-030 TaxID=3387277 RepID=UPI003F806326
MLSHIAQTKRPTQPFSGLADGIASGLLICGLIAGGCLAFRTLTGWQAVSPLILAIICGMLVRNLPGVPKAATAGIGFSLRRQLRLGIVLLGLQITAGQVVALGAAGLVTVVATLAATFLAITMVGRWLGVDRQTTGLIAAGTSVCGASAVIAANAAIRGREEDVAYAVACVTIFGSISMLVYPLLAAPLGLDAMAYGVWTGATVHEVAQVVAATFQAGHEAGEFGTISKLARVVLLAPLVMILGLTAFRTARGEHSAGAAPFPWFVVGFIAMAALNSVVDIPKALEGLTALASTFLLATGLAAMGLQTDIRALRAKGLRPLALGAFGWLFISVFGYVMVTLTGL